MREYYVSAGNLTLANAALTLLWINPPADRGIKIIETRVTWHGGTTAAMQRVQLVRQLTSFPTPQTSITPVRIRESDKASKIVGATTGLVGTAGANANAEGAGTKEVILADAFNIITGWLWRARLGEEIEFKVGSSYGFGIYFPAGVGANTAGWNASALFREAA